MTDATFVLDLVTPRGERLHLDLSDLKRVARRCEINIESDTFEATSVSDSGPVCFRSHDSDLITLRIEVWGKGVLRTHPED
jgi:hypothetical protein